MTTRGRGLVIRRRLQGLAFLVVLVLLLGLSVALYKKAFTDVAMVTLETDTAGSQLQEASDVKVRGVIVGEVREVEADLEGARIHMAINHEYLDPIPASSTTRFRCCRPCSRRTSPTRWARSPTPSAAAARCSATTW